MYITKAEITQYLGITIDDTLNTYIETLIGLAEEYVETYCAGGQVARRKFAAPDPDTATTRYYDGKGTAKLKIDDLREISSVVADGVTLTQNTDYYLYPLNAVEDGVCYEWIELIQPSTRLGNLNTNSRIETTSPYVFWERQRNVVVTGKWGFSATPPSAVKVACMKICGAIIKENIGDADLKEITSQSLGEYSVSYTKVADIAEKLGINDLLEVYKRKSNAAKTGVFLAR